MIKKDVMILAQWLADGEAMTATVASESLRTIVTRICADPSSSPLTIAMIAVAMAGHIDQMEPK